MSLRTSAHTGVAIRSPAAAQTEKQRLWRIRSCLRTHPGTTLLHPRTPAHLLHVIARSEATWQSVLLRQHRTKSNPLGEYEKHCEFALSTTVLPGISAGMRIAAPVCALVRNDMQKAVACQRLQGRFPAVPWQRPLANADTRQISACHCEERSDVAIRSPCSGTERKAILWANTKSATNSP